MERTDTLICVYCAALVVYILVLQAHGHWYTRALVHYPTPQFNGFVAADCFH